ncbi:MAG: hypothetical protein SO087_00880 [Candidatus Onthovivens sp.]|nr:hypothetical protein [Candidatus Onthovivens sp.]
MEINYSLPKTNILNKIFIAIINKKITNLHLVNISKVVNVCRNGLYYHFDSYQDLIVDLFNYSCLVYHLDFFNKYQNFNIALFYKKEFINFYSSLINIIGKLELINLLLINIKNKVKLNNFDKTLVEIRLNTFLTLVSLINLNKINFKTKQIKILLNIKEDPIC